MPEIETILAFLMASAVFAYMPGPATLYTTAQTVALGKRGGWMAALGIHIGGYFHVVATALGLAVLFTTIPTLYVVLKLAGAAFLILLGVKMFMTQHASTTSDEPVSIKSPRRAFWESASVEVLNPKTALFYLAFLPQFTDGSAALPIWGQLLVLGTIVNVMFSSADVLCVLLADKIAGWMKRSGSAYRVAQRIGGSLLIALGVNLAVRQH